MKRSSEQVLVVGGGPVGLTMASELYRHGVPCRVIDQNEAPQVWSKAAAMTPRTIEVLFDMGLSAQAHERGRPVYGMSLYKATDCIARVEFEIDGTPFPYMLGISQRDTELMLSEHLERLGGRLERPVTLESFRQNVDGVVATLVHADGEREEVEARFIIGCDGAKSTVRRVLDLPFEGSTFEQNLIQADIRVDFPMRVEPGEAVGFLSSAGLIVALPLLTEGRYRVIVPNMPNPDVEETLAVFQALAKERSPSGTTFYDADWIAKFHFHGRVVPRYRSGRVFLAGDAAHIHSPVGGQGMNMGMQDAYNLAWKLALVVRGSGRDSILDSYDPERRPVAQATVGVTDRATKAMMRMMALRSPIAEALRNQLMSFLVGSGLIGETVFKRVGQLAVSYAASPIVGEHNVSIWSSEVGLGRMSEQPKLGDWIGWKSALGPGERVPDTDVDGDRTLFQVLRGTRHVLFLFDGVAATPEGYANLGGIAKRVIERWGDHIDVHIVVPHAQKPRELDFSGSVILDEEAALHKHFGCNSEGLYLVRPDGYVGFRCQPAVTEKLYGYLETIFRA